MRDEITADKLFRVIQVETASAHLENQNGPFVRPVLVFTVAKLLHTSQAQDTEQIPLVFDAAQLSMLRNWLQRQPELPALEDILPRAVQ